MDFPLEVTQKRIKHAYIRIHPEDGVVRVSAPLFWSQSQVKAFVASREVWIQKQLGKVTWRKQAATSAADEGAVAWWGDWAAMDALPHRDVQQAYAEGIRGRLHALLPHWSEALDVPHPAVQLRRMKTRWGSCTPARQHIRLNTQLAQYPPECLEYVLVHELVHFIELSHNTRFQRLMTQALPQWKRIRARLKQSPVLSEPRSS